MKLDSDKMIIVTGLLQIIAVVIGFFALAISMKVNGYPDMVDPTIRWNPGVLFLRHYGWTLLGFPLLWLAYSLIATHKESDLWDPYIAVIIGYSFAVFVLLAFIILAASPYTRPMLVKIPA